jgi:NAD(P)-dependent dehydrogenase (short-subunit alcohol dehydrogenase family)
LGNPEGIAEWLAGIVTETGPLDGLTHCAGITSLTPLRVLSVKHAAEVMRVNYESAVALTTAFSRKRAHRTGSSIVLVASVAGSVGVAGSAAYSGSKGALMAFARSAALELAPGGIRVNCVAPAYVRTEMYERNLKAMTAEQLVQRVAATQPLGLGTPLDVAHAIAFLLADTGRWITGSVLTEDGGYTAQ